MSIAIVHCSDVFVDDPDYSDSPSGYRKSSIPTMDFLGPWVFRKGQRRMVPSCVE